MRRTARNRIGFCLLCTLCLLLPLWTEAASGAENKNAISYSVDKDFIWYRLHFGLGSGASPVSFDTIAKFVDNNITPLFPSGLTMTQARGQWQSPQGLIRENTFVVDLQCKDTDENWNSIQHIAKLYVDENSSARASCFIKRIPGITTTLFYATPN
ncbi:DUF3574 domain-containing protein [Desulfovibrio sp. OttesenSCG-928-G15]|nr:DUF3574 domain-containing protein [Desulfovibrio sp. OttesenSCG-928-G15]